ncbi:hypothetical protein ACLQ2Q_21360 [Microbacterium sp. DT81.1]|uniref:hypothetical protein n=1 Tax=Microbacterium sp. DT81.1 TaxID=3393413 RepID=UPI003CEBEBF2
MTDNPSENLNSPAHADRAAASEGASPTASSATMSELPSPPEAAEPLVPWWNRASFWRGLGRPALALLAALASILIPLAVLQLWAEVPVFVIDGPGSDEWPYIAAAILFFLGIVGTVFIILGPKFNEAWQPVFWALGIGLYGVVAAFLLSNRAMAALNEVAWWPKDALDLQALIFALVSTALVPIIAAVHVAGVEKSETSAATTVLMLWTAIVVFGISYVAASTVHGDSAFVCATATSVNCVDADAWPQYALLIGLPGVAAALAKKDDGKLISHDESAVATNQVTTVQYVAFNAIAMVFVVGGLLLTHRLGEIPEILLALTGASALTYSLVKPSAAR